MLALNEDDLGASRDAIKTFIAKFQVIHPQVHSCLGLALQVHDLVGRRDMQMALRAAQKGRRKRLTNWLSQTEEVGFHQREALESVTAEASSLNQTVVMREVELRAVDQLLWDRKNEYSQLILAIEEEKFETEKIREERQREIDQAHAAVQEAKEEVVAIDKAVEFVRHDVETYRNSEKKLIQKKLDMMRELSKRLEQERKVVQAMPVASKVVDDLTEAMSTAMFGKQDLIEELKAKEERLKWLQAETQRKSFVISELRGMTIPKSRENRSDQEMLEDIDELLSDIQAQNEVHFENLQIAGFEAEGLEAERASLRGILKDL
jgi:hypothetical protein